jgi:GTP-binding protein YchF
VQVGIIGLKFTGKTTLFNVITGAGVPTGQGGVDPNRAMGTVPDPRLDFLSGLYQPKKTVHVQVEWVDVPGFNPGPGQDGAREATRFLEHARRVDALAQVVRCHDGGYGDPDPEGELATVSLELILADLQIVEKRLEKLDKERRLKGKTEQPLEPALFARFKAQLESERPLRELDLTADERRIVSGYSLLTLKPLMVVLNHAEGEDPPADVAAAARASGAEVVSLCAAVEEELAELEPEEAREFLDDLGIEESAAHRMIRAAYAALDLHSFFTVGPDECRAWTVRRGALAPTAAGVIHSDLERGFIRAEVCAYDDLVAAGNHPAAKAAGKVRLEGKGYEVQDGDIIEIRFNV